MTWSGLYYTEDVGEMAHSPAPTPRSRACAVASREEVLHSSGASVVDRLQS